MTAPLEDRIDGLTGAPVRNGPRHLTDHGVLAAAVRDHQARLALLMPPVTTDVIQEVLTAVTAPMVDLTLLYDSAAT